jgi:hypothetical protein
VPGGLKISIPEIMRTGLAKEDAVVIKVER